MSDAAPNNGTPTESAAPADDKAAAKAARKAARKAGRAERRTRKAERPAAGKVPAGHREPAEVKKQLGAILRAAHPRQAVLLALAVGGLAMLTDRGILQSLVAGGAVLVVQLCLGLGNDLADEKLDRAAGTEGKPLAAGDVARGNVSTAAAALFLVAIPLALQNGWLAGVILLGTLVLGAVHNKWLHRGLFSWVGWVVTFGLLPAYLSYGSFPGEEHGPAPTYAFTAAAAFLGLCLHFATSLPDLVQDHAAGLKPLPLRIALRTGAPRLLRITAVATVLALVALLVAGLTVGIRQ